jgi:hypothetical protein
MTLSTQYLCFAVPQLRGMPDCYVKRSNGNWSQGFLVRDKEAQTQNRSSHVINESKSATIPGLTSYTAVLIEDQTMGKTIKADEIKWVVRDVFNSISKLENGEPKDSLSNAEVLEFLNRL